MALSMFLRTPACTGQMFGQQMLRTVSQPSLTQRALSSSLSARSHVLKEGNTRPLLNAVRNFRTSIVRLSAEKSHDHSKLWLIERGVSGALIPLVPLALMIPNKFFDSILAVLITAHSFWGLEAIAVDYVRASLFGPLIPKIAIGLVYLLSIATLGGLFYIISHDIGIANSVRQLWSIKSEQKA